MKYKPTPANFGDEDVRGFWKATCKQSYSHQSNTGMKKIAATGAPWRGGGAMP